MIVYPTQLSTSDQCADLLKRMYDFQILLDNLETQVIDVQVKWYFPNTASPSIVRDFIESTATLGVLCNEYNRILSQAQRALSYLMTKAQEVD